MVKRNFVWALMTIIFLLLAFSCGARIDKKAFGPDEYFEYAKKKFDKGKYLEARTNFNVIILKFSGNKIVDDAQYYLAESHFKEKEYLIAISEYKTLINDYPQSSYNILAQFKIGLSYFKLSNRPALDQEYTKKAIRQFQDFIELYPGHELKTKAENQIQELRQKLAQKVMLGGDTYRKMGICKSAIIYYDIVISRYYDKKNLVSKALYWKGECLFKLKQFTEAQDTFTIFLENYPDHKESAKAKKQIENILKILTTNHAKK